MITFLEGSSGAGISDTRGLISCHSNRNNVLNILGNCDEWPSGSARFFLRDHKNQGDGLRGLVFNSVIDSKVYSDFSSLSVEDMFLHLHIASVYYGLPTTKSVDLATMTLHNNSPHNRLIQSEKKVYENYQNSIVQVLVAHGIN